MRRGASGSGIRCLTTPPSTPPPVTPPASPAARAGVSALPRELADFLVELSITLNKHTIYPAAHPLLGVAIDGVANRLALLFIGERASLSIGVARKQLIIEGVATDSQNPVLKELAERLHKHHVGAMKLQRGITRDELADALSALAVDAVRSDKPLGLAGDALADRWHHVHFFPLTYDRLQLIDDDGSGEPAAPDQMAASRSTQLWVGLARAALATDAAHLKTSREAPDESTALEPATVARAIDEHEREQAYDQVIVGYLLQIGEELKSAEGPEAAGLQRRVSHLVGSLKQETLERLLEMGGDKRQRRKFLLDASQGVTVEAVIELVKAASLTEGQSVSHSMLRMLGKLAHHPSDSAPRQRANPIVKDVMKRLIDDWSLDDPNPEAYKRTLESISRHSGAPRETNASATPTECEPERLLKIGIELASFGPRVRSAMLDLRDAGRFDVLLDLVEGAPSADAGAPVAEFLMSEQVFKSVLGQERVDFALAARFAQRMGRAAALPILDAVVAVKDTKLRVPYYELLESLGDDAGGEVAARLAAAPPQIQRELLALLGRLPGLPAGFSARPFLRHEDPLVRREAVRMLLREPGARDTTIMSALADPDNRVAFAGLAAAQEKCSAACVDLIRRRVERGAYDSRLRTMGIRIVARQQTPTTLKWLLAFVVTEARWPLRARLRSATPEMLAALSAIAAFWSSDRDAATALKLAEKSKDPQVRAKLVRGAAAQQRDGSGER